MQSTLIDDQLGKTMVSLPPEPLETHILKNKYIGY